MAPVCTGCGFTSLHFDPPGEWCLNCIWSRQDIAVALFGWLP